MEKRERQSNFELLRIIAMLLIIAHHFVVHGVEEYINISSFNLINECFQILKLGGKLGINLFMLISGYYLIDRDKINIKKIVKYVLKVWIYSISILLIVMFGLKDETIGIGCILNSLFPIMSCVWWYATCYFLILLISPLINKLLKLITKKEFQCLIIIGFFVLSLIPSLNKDFGFGLEDNIEIWMLYVYLSAAYIKINNFDLKNKYKYFAIFFCILIIALKLFLDFLSQDNSIFLEYSETLGREYNVFTFLFSIILFLIFKNMNFKSKLINAISSTTFSIYLIHDNPILYKYIWSGINSVIINFDVWKIVALSIAYILFVFFECSVIGLVLNNLIAKVYLVIDKNFSKIDAYIRKKSFLIINVYKKIFK